MQALRAGSKYKPALKRICYYINFIGIVKITNFVLKILSMKPFKFTPYLKSVLWGGTKIAALKGIEVDRSDIGESWEISGVPGNETCVSEGEYKGYRLSELIKTFKESLLGKKVYEAYGDSFPLLVKIIDANRDLSVQVHPDDSLAQHRHHCPGKTEMWYILDAEPGARIYAGLCRQLTPATYKEHVESKTIMDDIAAHESHPGDVFFLPAGRIHAIGAGNLLVEIQQTSDITYRIYDYDRVDADGNPRQLHTDLAADAIDYTVYPDYKSASETQPDGSNLLAECRYFSVREHDVDGTVGIDYAHGSFVIMVCTNGSLTIHCDGSETYLSQGESLLVPAERADLSVSGRGQVVTACVPL